jgi:adenylosuccinate lyase
LNDAALVNVIERVGHLREHVERAPNAQRRRPIRRGERLAFHQLHHHEGAVLRVLAKIHDGHDVRMRDLARELRLEVEALACLRIARKRRRDDLQREVLRELTMTHAIDKAHAALPQTLLDLVPTPDRPHHRPLYTSRL